MSDGTFVVPDLTTFTRLDGLGLEVIGQLVEDERSVLECRVVEGEDDRWCRRCGSQGRPRDSVIRELAHEPFGWRPTTLRVRVRRYGCTGCSRVWRQDTTRAAPPRAKISRAGVRWALIGLVAQHLSMARIAEGLGVSWNTANDAVLAEGQRVLIDDPARLEGVAVIGVDEHVWRHTRRGDRFVTVIIDLTPVRDGTGPARLLDMVPGRSKAVFKTWLGARSQAWRDSVEVVAMDGFTGFKTATAEDLPAAAAVMDPFHVVRLAGDAVTVTRQRTQRSVHGRRGRKGDPLYTSRRTLLTGQDLLNDKQQARLNTLFDDPAHTELHHTWTAYQEVIAAYRDPNRTSGKRRLQQLIRALSLDLRELPTELRKLARTLTRRAADILAYFDRPRTSNGPTEAINGRLEHLRGSALGFRNLLNYITRALLETGGFRPHLHPRL